MRPALISLQMLFVLFLSGCSTIPLNEGIFSATEANSELYTPKSDGVDKLSKKNWLPANYLRELTIKPPWARFNIAITAR